MKLSKSAPSYARGRHREATAIEKSFRAVAKKYGFMLTKYVVMKIIEIELAKKKLAELIEVKEKELDSLKNKKSL